MQVVEAAAPLPVPPLFPGTVQCVALVAMARVVAALPVVQRVLRANVPPAELGADCHSPLVSGLYPLPVSLEEQEHADQSVLFGKVQQGGVQVQGLHFGGGVKTPLKTVECGGGEDPGLRHAEDLDSRPGDDAEDTLAANEQVVEVGGRRILGHGTGVQDAAVAQDDLQRHHLLPHGAKGAGAVAYAVGGNGARHGGDGDAVGVVPNHQVLSGQGISQVLQDDAGSHRGGHVARADFDNLVEAFYIDNNSTLDGQHASHDARAAAVGHQGNAFLGGQGRDTGNLLNRTGTHHYVGELLKGIAGAVGAEGSQGIGGVSVQVVGGCEHVVLANNAGQGFNNGSCNHKSADLRRKY